jgi:two-component system sensor histidine kinase MprB
MSLRGRLAVISAVAVALAVVLAASILFYLTRRQLIQEVDESLVDRVSLITSTGGDVRGLPSRAVRFLGPGEPLGRSDRGFDALYAQVVLADGQVLVPRGVDSRLPVDDVDVAVAGGEGARTVRTVATAQGSVRMITEPVRDGVALQLARSLDEVDASLVGVRTALLWAGVLGAVIAAGLGLAVARSALRPVAALTDAAEHVAATQELAARIPVARQDELGRLAASFNSMLEALQRSRSQQHRLVRDAGHELRTPLTALRTNIEVLAKRADMEPQERSVLVEDLKFEIEQLSALASELIDLATDSEAEEAVESVHLDEAVADVVDRFRRRFGHAIDVTASPAVVEVRPTRLDRAVSNLLDNAIKWSPEGEPIVVTVGGGRVAVRDHGPGIPPEDKARVFDRFYRADAARATLGSGLGLSIVQQFAEAHGGTVFADEAPGGGALVGFELPTVAP